jgi:hypothetical protein
MKALQIVGIVLIVVGAVSLACPGIPRTENES